MTLSKIQKEKVRIIRLKERKKKRGEVALDLKWMKFFDDWCDEAYVEIDKRKAEEKEKYLDFFMYRGKMFLFYNMDKVIRK